MQQPKLVMCVCCTRRASSFDWMQHMQGLIQNFLTAACTAGNNQWVPNKQLFLPYLGFREEINQSNGSITSHAGWLQTVLIWKCGCFDDVIAALNLWAKAPAEAWWNLSSSWLSPDPIYYIKCPARSGSSLLADRDHNIMHNCNHECSCTVINSGNEAAAFHLHLEKCASAAASAAESATKMRWRLQNLG